jgi:hypothetical protein
LPPWQQSAIIRLIAGELAPDLVWRNTEGAETLKSLRYQGLQSAAAITGRCGNTSGEWRQSRPPKGKRNRIRPKNNRKRKLKVCLIIEPRISKTAFRQP